MENKDYVYYEEFEETKVVMRIRISKKNRQHNGQQFEDTKVVMRIRISKKDRQRTRYQYLYRKLQKN
jgi:hypothetical protein